MQQDTQKYSSKSNVRRAVRREHGPNVQEGKHYDIIALGSKEFTFRMKETPKALPLTNKSVVENPVQLVWSIADEMLAKQGEKLRRKDVIAECVKQGIAFYTARTQYQLWYSAPRKGGRAIRPTAKR